MNFLNEPAEIGIINKVSLKNFMCHSQLTLSFGPHVNFLLGKNGSGKSAVLAAIMVALGGKVSATGRGLNIKEIIQKGKQKAIVSVSLKNTGNDAFRPEDYGSAITVERKLKNDGSSSYKLRDSKGGIVSTKKTDLDAIVSAFNIQVRNPVAILTQDVSKCFLNSRDNRDKYMLFFKATQLESLENFYRQAQKLEMDTRAIFESKTQAIPRLKYEMQELGKKLINYQSLEVQKQQLLKLYQEFAWSVAIEKERCAEHLLQYLEKVDATAAEEMKRLEHAEAKFKEAVAKENSTKENAAKVQSEIRAIKERLKLVNNRKFECRQKLREAQGVVQKLSRGISEQEKQVSYFANSIENLVQHAQEDLERRKREQEDKLRHHQQKLAQLTATLAAEEEKLEHQKGDLNDLKNVQETNAEESRALNYRIEATTKDIIRIQHCQMNSLNAYGKQMPLFLKRIEESAARKEFIKKPKGPLGRYVKVKDPQWALAVECCLGTNLLRSFLCDNERDKETLYGIMQDVFPFKMPQVITGPFRYELYDVSLGRVAASKYCCLQDMLDVADPVIMNCLIDERAVETVILIAKDEEARNVMLSGPPQRCAEAFTLKGTSVHPNPFRCYASKKKRVALISIPENFAESVTEKMAELKSLNEASVKLQSKAEDLKQRLLRQDRAVRQTERPMNQLRNLIYKENTEMKEMEVLEEPGVIVHSFEDELKKSKLALENLRSSKEEKLHTLESCLEELKNIEIEEQSWIEEQEVKNAELTALSRSAVVESSKSSSSILRDKSIHEKKYKEISQKLVTVKQEYEKVLYDAKKNASEAEAICPRIETEKNPLTIEIMINQTKEIIERGTEDQGNIVEISEQYELKQQLYRQAHHEVKRMKHLLEKRKNMVNCRLRAFEDLRNHVGLRVQYLFATNLHVRGYTGGLKFDHAKRSLVINAKPNSSTVVHSTRGLSGGEKSFVTVALLLALWDAVEIPFRILDEYDVYMDQVNRKRSMDLMLSTALEHCSNQFIFLSPLDLVKITASEKIKIIHLTNPERLKEHDEPMDVE